MKSFFSERGNGEDIIPSARKSIHNHCNCPFWHSEAMGRYGLVSNKRQEQGLCTSQEGTDEVDNVMSKLARASSPITTRRNDNLRRNSYNSPKQVKQNYTDNSDEDSNILSKSSPAILSPYSCCSEEPEVNGTHYTYESANSFSQDRLNESRTNSLQNTPQNVERYVHSRYSNVPQSTKNDTTKWIFGSLLIALVCIFVGYILHTKANETSSVIYDKFSFYNDVRGVGSKYKIDDNSLLRVQAGIAAIYEKQDTGSFIFAYNSNRRDFDFANFNNFVNELATAAAKYLRNHTKTIQHVVVDTSNLQVQSDKELMNEYLADVDKTGVMLVNDVDRVPSALAMAFHYYCDEYNPLVKKSAIFFTLNVARCSNVSSERYTHGKIEKCLAEKWVTMPEDNIRPLLTRVVNVVIDVTSEF